MKRSLRDFLLTLGIAVVVFTLAAVFLIRGAEALMNDMVDYLHAKGSPAQTAEGPDPAATGDPGAPAEDRIISFLVLGLDHEKQNADAIFLVAINATQNKMTAALIPSNTYVSHDGKKQNLGDTYSTRGASYISSFVQMETGLSPDYYIAISMDGLSNLIDFLGGINYLVPQNMYAFDPVHNFKINLKVGSQLLTGDQAVQLLTYRGYLNGVQGREETHLTFAKTFCSTFLKAENIPRAKEIMYNVYHNVDTDFSSTEFLAQIEILFNFPSYSATFNRIHGAVGSDGYYSIRTAQAKAMFEDYVK